MQEMNQLDHPVQTEERFNVATGALRGLTPEESIRIQRRPLIGKSTDSAIGSLQRIHEAIMLATTEEVGPLLKSDLDNAAKHAAQVAKHIRSIKKALFPVVDKPLLPEVKTEQ